MAFIGTIVEHEVATSFSDKLEIVLELTALMSLMCVCMVQDIKELRRR